MGETVLVTIPVSAEAARRLEEPGKREEIGRLVSRMIAPRGPEDDPLGTLLDTIRGRAQAKGVTDAEVEAELEAWRAEGRP
jgi:hypothetical protein